LCISSSEIAFFAHNVWQKKALRLKWVRVGNTIVGRVIEITVLRCRLMIQTEREGGGGAAAVLVPAETEAVNWSEMEKSN